MKLLHLCAPVLLLAAAGCSQPQSSANAPAVDLAKEEQAVRAADAQWLAAAQSHDLEKAVNSWSEDATLVVPGQPLIKGRDAIRKYVAASFATPGFSIKWVTDQVVVSKSGDMAYSSGEDTFTFPGPNKKVVTQKAYGVAIWRKDPDGTWRAVMDISSPH